MSLNFANLFGVPVRLHWTLLSVVFGLAAASGVTSGWRDAFEVSLMLSAIFACVLAHEYGHVMAARAHGIGTRRITLTPLGGVAWMDGYPKSPLGRALVALAGPAVTMVLAALLWLVYLAWPEGDVRSFLSVIAQVNTVILVFNLLPFYPLDGGHVLNSILWKLKGRTTANRISSLTGQAAAIGMFAVGIYTSHWMLSAVAVALFVMTRSEFGTKAGVAKPTPARDSEEDEDLLSYGVFVSFDGKGRMFAASRHWKDVQDLQDRMAMKAEIESNAEEASRNGGSQRLVSPQEFHEIVRAQREMS